MEMKHRNLILALVFAVVIPVILVAIVMLFMFIIMPNLNNNRIHYSDTVTKDNTVVNHGDGGNNNNYLVLMGVICVCVLIIIIIALVIAVCFWTAYISNQGYDSSRECIITSFNKGENKVEFPLRQSVSVTVPDNRNDNHQPSTLNTQKIKEETIKNVEDVPDKDCRVVSPIPRPVSYGSLNRSRFLSSVDEDGFHIDNFGLDDDDENKSQPVHHKALSRSETCDSFDDRILQAVSNLEKELHLSETDSPEENPQKISSPKSESRKSAPPSRLIRQLSRKESSFSLPPLKSFDNYLSLVDLDLIDSPSTSPTDEASPCYVNSEVNS